MDDVFGDTILSAAAEEYILMKKDYMGGAASEKDYKDASIRFYKAIQRHINAKVDEQIEQFKESTKKIEIDQNIGLTWDDIAPIIDMLGIAPEPPDNAKEAMSWIAHYKHWYNEAQEVSEETKFLIDYARGHKKNDSSM